MPVSVSCVVCKKEVFVKLLESKPEYVVWCSGCVGKYAPELNRLGIEYSFRYDYNVWGKAENVEKLNKLLADIKDNSSSSDEPITKPEIHVAEICPKRYYGMGSCYCGGCKMTKNQASANYTDPFGYRFSHPEKPFDAAKSISSFIENSLKQFTK